MKKIIMLLAVAVFACACNKFLDVKPMGKLIPEKAAELDNLLNNEGTVKNMFFDNNNGNFLAFLGDNLRVSDNEATYRWKPGANNLERYAAYIYSRPYQNPRAMQYAWENGIYLPAGIYNTIIEGMNDLPAAEADTEYARGVVAQARTARAWTYMIGGLCYGPMWNPNGANTGRGITYRTAADPAVANPQLATTEELFALVLQDLEYGLAHAPELVSNPTRADKAAVKAILAEYYMYKRDWPNMLKYADEAWTTMETRRGGVENMIYDYNTWNYGTFTPTTPDKASAEVSRQLVAPAGFNQTYAIENLFYRMAPNSIGSAKNYPSDEYRALFMAGDQRERLFMLRAAGYKSGTNDDGIQIYHYRDDKLTVGSTTDSRNEGITFPLLLLMRAEAYWRTGDMGKALADLNTLRRFRYDAVNAELTGLTGDDLMVEILRERRLEQPMTSFQRILDLKRFVYDTGKPWCKTSITHTLDSETFTAPINDTYFTLPLSNDAIIRNPQWGLKTNDTAWTPAG